MKLTLCNEVLRDHDFREQCRLAAALGYDGLEVAPFTLSEDPATISSSDRQTLRQTAEDHGLSITGLHWLFLTPSGLSLTSDDPETVRRTRSHIEALIDLCADLGGKVLIHGSPQQRMLSDASSPEHARDTALEHLHTAGELCVEADATYCIEPLAPHLTDFVNTVAEAVKLIEEAGSAGLATMLDTLAAWNGEAQAPETVLDQWLGTGRIAHIHFNDTNSQAPGQGDRNFADILATLQEHRYSGYVGIEPFKYEPSGVAAAACAAGYLRGLEDAGRAAP
ncbi:tagatose 3-epimerase [Devosia pacifica]|uniref:Tagatose 3-epimerase n=1 Tax=Devosia pacifica TaxID=1335967 RepID=A0A918S057_9HYPH|nr:tagatose 3-epimerase [Devosia pacifica]